jgi:hypothetical protein
VLCVWGLWAPDRVLTLLCRVLAIWHSTKTFIF